MIESVVWCGGKEEMSECMCIGIDMCMGGWGEGVCVCVCTMGSVACAGSPLMMMVSVGSPTCIFPVLA
ncbi:hypothetical protein EON65_16435 [archaeon]|nr:MAG: hypothetical protein EON65_16435 [archaeon]